jgi:hypothetical protein
MRLEEAGDHLVDLSLVRFVCVEEGAVIPGILSIGRERSEFVLGPHGLDLGENRGDFFPREHCHFDVPNGLVSLLQGSVAKNLSHNEDAPRDA